MALYVDRPALVRALVAQCRSCGRSLDAFSAVKTDDGKVTLCQRCYKFISHANEIKRTITNTLLSERQLDCVRLTCSGMRQKRIAAELGITEKTVLHHLREARLKLNAKTTAQLACIVSRQDLFSAESEQTKVSPAG